MAIASQTRSPETVASCMPPPCAAGRGESILRSGDRVEEGRGRAASSSRSCDRRMARPTRSTDGRAMSEIQIRDVHGREFVDGCALLAASLEFSDRDAVPPWLAQTAAGFGGLALGAFEQDRLVGFSFALPAG